MTDGKRIDIFARQKRDGFDGWGNEYGKLEINIKKPKALKAVGKKGKPGHILCFCQIAAK